MGDPICKVILTKQFDYRADPGELFANVYEFLSPAPSGDTAWKALFDLVWSGEAAIFPPGVKLMHALGYNDNDPHAAHAALFDYSSEAVTGVFAPGPALRGAGDQAACVEWRTDIKSKAGKPVYMRKYLHNPYLDPADLDSLAGNYVTVLNAYAAALQATHGGLSVHSPGQPRRTAVAHTVIPWVTTRTLHKRGKKKAPA